MRVVDSSLWADTVQAYTMREVKPGVFEYVYVEAERVSEPQAS